MKIYLDEATQVKLKKSLEDLETLQLAEENDLLREAISIVKEILSHDECKNTIWNRKKGH